MPAGNLMVGKLPLLPVRTHARAVAEALALRPDTGIENADDDVLAFDAPRPQTRSAFGQPEERRGRRRVHLNFPRLLDSDHARSALTAATCSRVSAAVNPLNA